jgi:hypothetical protein
VASNSRHADDDDQELWMELDLGAVRAFLAVVDDGHFTEAADRLDMTQQAVSKRIARLESDLGVALLTRSRAGAPIDMVRDFYEAGDVEVDIVASRGTVSRWTVLADGSVDAAFGRATRHPTSSAPADRPRSRCLPARQNARTAFVP